jgi:hypothetical protein
VLFIVLAIIGTMKMDYDHRADVVQFQCGEFDQKIDIFYVRMVVKVINVLSHFLSF